MFILYKNVSLYPWVLKKVNEINLKNQIKKISPNDSILNVCHFEWKISYVKILKTVYVRQHIIGDVLLYLIKVVGDLKEYGETVRDRGKEVIWTLWLTIR